MLAPAWGAILGEDWQCLFEGTHWLLRPFVFKAFLRDVRSLETWPSGSGWPIFDPDWIEPLQLEEKGGEGRGGQSRSDFAGMEAWPRQLQKAGAPLSGRKADSPTGQWGAGIYPAWQHVGPCACLSIQHHLRGRSISLNVGNHSKIWAMGVSVWGSQVYNGHLPPGINGFQWHPEREHSQVIPDSHRISYFTKC